MWITKESEDSENMWPVLLWIGVHASGFGIEMITSTQKNPRIFGLTEAFTVFYTGGLPVTSFRIEVLKSIPALS